MLRIAGHDERVEEWLRPIPFRRHATDLRESPRRRSDRESDRGPSDSIRMAEQALDRAQRDLDEMNRLLSSEPLPFPARSDDDGPSAAYSISRRSTQ